MNSQRAQVQSCRETSASSSSVRALWRLLPLGSACLRQLTSINQVGVSCSGGARTSAETQPWHQPRTAGAPKLPHENGGHLAGTGEWGLGATLKSSSLSFLTDSEDSRGLGKCDLKMMRVFRRIWHTRHWQSQEGKLVSVCTLHGYGFENRKGIIALRISIGLI